MDNIQVNFEIFWSVIAALLAYDIIFGFLAGIGGFISGRSCSEKVYVGSAQGSGPRGMVVKGRDSLSTESSAAESKE